MNIRKKLLKSIIFCLLLGISTALIITIFSPVSAQENIDSNTSEFSLIAKKKHSPQILFERGKTLFGAAKFQEAAKTWQHAAEGFEHQGDKINQAWSLSLVSLALQNLGELPTAEIAIDKSLELLQNQKGNTEILAVSLNTKGSLKIKMGQARAALEAWQEA